MPHNEAVGGGASTPTLALLPLSATGSGHIAPQCLHWWQQYATGILHLRSSNPDCLKKKAEEANAHSAFLETVDNNDTVS
jgi:hypothetical protein